MAFSIGKMLSRINYFKKDEDCASSEETSKKRRHTNSSSSGEMPLSLDVDKPEPDSTSIACATSLKLPDSVKTFGSKKGSLSDTDLLKLEEGTILEKGKPKKSKKLKLDIKKANRSMSEALNKTTHKPNENIENTPTHISLSCRSSQIFCERLRDFELNQSFDIFDAMSEGRPDTPEETDNFDIESLSDGDSDTSLSNEEDKADIKMCRKVEEVYNSTTSIEENRIVPSATPESFGDVELDKNEDERTALLLSYQMKLEKAERFLKKLLTEFQFHIEFSKIFHCKSVVTALPGSDITNLPKTLGEITYVDMMDRGELQGGSWDIVIEKEDNLTKLKLKKQLLSMKQHIEEFIESNFNRGSLNQSHKSQETTLDIVEQTNNFFSHNQKRITCDGEKNRQKTPKRLRFNKKKNIRYNDYPDLKQALQNLFGLDSEHEDENNESAKDVEAVFTSTDDNNLSKCTCTCQYHRMSTPMSDQSDSGLTTKTGDDRSLSQSITSSIGNFTLDSTTLSAYSESLDQIISYNSFEDTSLFSTMLQKAAIERITFYVQVHSMQLRCESNEHDFETKNVIIFFCPACSTSETEEHGVLKHILSQKHCEKIHFLYKTAYIKKCFASGKEIQPSTVLNPMTMYRDVNKIVCFGDAMYACSLCFENLIVGESVLMAHCGDSEHQQRRDRLSEVLE